MSEELDKRALAYHAAHPPGKLEIAATKPMATQEDLSLAYSPGVAAPCLAIADDPGNAPLYTGRGNLVGVVSNGTAVLGLGAIGAMAAKPFLPTVTYHGKKIVKPGPKLHWRAGVGSTLW